MSKKFTDAQLGDLIRALEHVYQARLLLLNYVDEHDELYILEDKADDLQNALYNAIPIVKYDDLENEQVNEALKQYLNSCTEFDEAKNVRQVQRRYEIGQLTNEDKERIEWAFKELIIEKTLHPERF